jgi:hypothetical protein
MHTLQSNLTGVLLQRACIPWQVAIWLRNASQLLYTSFSLSTYTHEMLLVGNFAAVTAMIVVFWRAEQSVGVDALITSPIAPVWGAFACSLFPLERVMSHCVPEPYLF